MEGYSLEVHCCDGTPTNNSVLFHQGHPVTSSFDTRYLPLNNSFGIVSCQLESMLAIRGRRQAASQARTSDEISSSSSWWESISESKKEPEPQASEPRGGFFRRSRLQPRSSNVEDRNDIQQSRGHLAKRDTSGSQGKSKSGQRSKSSDRARREVVSPADANILSLRSDNRQKKVVYKSFSENPFKVLTIDVEESPPIPKYENHVVLKVAVS